MFVCKIIHDKQSISAICPISCENGAFSLNPVSFITTIKYWNTQKLLYAPVIQRCCFFFFHQKKYRKELSKKSEVYTFKNNKE